MASQLSWSEAPCGRFKDREPNVPISTLQSKWVDGTIVLYIGKAGGTNGAKWSDHTLQQRVQQYMDIGSGEPARHWGGRYIWQLQDSKDLLVCWKPISRATGDPTLVESDYLNQFKKTYGKLPFANLRH